MVGILQIACSYGFENSLMFFKKFPRVQYIGDGGKMTELFEKFQFGNIKIIYGYADHSPVTVLK